MIFELVIESGDVDTGLKNSSRAKNQTRQPRINIFFIFKFIVDCVET